MKQFINPVIEILSLNPNQDIISTSGQFGDDNPCGVIDEIDM